MVETTAGHPKRTPTTRHTRVVRVTCVHEPTLGTRSLRTAEVAMQFGIPLFGRPTTIVEPTRIGLGPGSIVLLLGPSGSGKTTALGALHRALGGGCVVNRVAFPHDVAVLDRIAPWAPLRDALSILSTCALGEPHLWVRRFQELSDGEKFRARLARAVGLHLRDGVSRPLVCDEFCSNLHRRAARAISFNLRKLVDRRRLCVVLASSHDDVVTDLQPDVVVRLTGAGPCSVDDSRRRVRRPISLRRRLVIDRGSLRDYDAFAAMHYRPAEQLALIDTVFVLRERGGGDTLAVLAYGYAPLELSLRNHATAGRFRQNHAALNRSMRILRRLVVHPDVRGCGLGHYFVRQTLPLVGTNYVECLAAMGDVNPVFEKAGMRRIGRCPMPPRRRRAVAALRAIDVDPSARDFPMHVARSRRVRHIVARAVFDWYQATTTNPRQRLDRQSPETLAQIFRGLLGSPPVYYLWSKRKAISRRSKVEGRKVEG